VLCQKEIILSNSITKAPLDSQGRWNGEQLIEQPWLQLMSCAPISSHEVVAYFGMERSRQRRGPKEVNKEIWIGQGEG